MTTSRKEAEKLLAQARADYEAALSEHQATEKAFDKEPSPELAERAAAQESKWRAYQRLVAVRERQVEEATKAEQEAARRKQIAELAGRHETLRLKAREAMRQYERACEELAKAVEVFQEVGSEPDTLVNQARGLGAILPRLGPGELKSSCEACHGPLRAWLKPVTFQAPPANLEAPKGLVDVKFARDWHTVRDRAAEGEAIITTRSIAKRLSADGVLETAPADDEPEAVEAAE